MEERARSRRAEVREDWREGDGENEVSGEGIRWMGGGQGEQQQQQR
jgi:hypothetical protein